MSNSTTLKSVSTKQSSNLNLASFDEVTSYLDCKPFGQRNLGFYVTSDFYEIGPAYEISNTKSSAKANRKPAMSHVKKLMKSIEKADSLLSIVTLVRTDVFGGNMGIYIADGGHRIKAIQLLLEKKEYEDGYLSNGRKLEVICRVYNVKTKQEYFDLVAQLNSTSKPFGNLDYLHGHSWVGKTDYTRVEKYLTKFKKVEKTYPLELVVGVAKDGKMHGDKWRSGEFEIENRFFERDLNRLNEIRDLFYDAKISGCLKVPFGRAILQAWILEKGYNHVKATDLLLERLSKNKQTFPTQEQDVKLYLDKMYSPGRK